jgi:hypothetical protein
MTATETQTIHRRQEKRMVIDTKCGWRVIGALGIAAAFAITQPSAKAQSCTAGDVIGTWRGQIMTDPPWDVTVDLGFRFEPNGTYVYTAGQGSFQWTAHQGRYTIRRNSGPSSRSYPCLLTLIPEPGTIRNNPQNKLGLMPLQARSLMADQPRTFRMQFLSVLMLQDTELEWQDVGMFGIHRTER